MSASEERGRDRRSRGSGRMSQRDGKPVSACAAAALLGRFLLRGSADVDLWHEQGKVVSVEWMR
jgi:hypothetical protein